MKPNRVFPPHPEEKMGFENPTNTICETLRLAYKAIGNNDTEDAKLKIRIAITMAKAMSKKLEAYSKNYARALFSEKGGR